jgi:hypothetical protein
VNLVFWRHPRRVSIWIQGQVVDIDQEMKGTYVTRGNGGTPPVCCRQLMIISFTSKLTPDTPLGMLYVPLRLYDNLYRSRCMSMNDQIIEWSVTLLIQPPLCQNVVLHKHVGCTGHESSCDPIFCLILDMSQCVAGTRYLRGQGLTKAV